jgi:hypothetical protein
LFKSAENPAQSVRWNDAGPPAATCCGAHHPGRAGRRGRRGSTSYVRDAAQKRPPAQARHGGAPPAVDEAGSPRQHSDGHFLPVVPVPYQSQLAPPRAGLFLCAEHDRLLGVKVLHLDLLAEQLQMMVFFLPGLIEYINAGRLRPLAVTTATRLQALPDVPALMEYFPGYEATGWPGTSPLKLWRP